MSFNNIYYLQLLQPLYLAEQDHLCNFGRGHHEEHFQFGPVVQRKMLFKDISYLELW